MPLETCLGGIEQAVPAGADTDGRAEPLAQVQVGRKTHLAQAILLLEDGVETGADADEHVVERTVGHIGTTDDLTSLIAVGILLRKSVEGEQEACRSKQPDEFDTFHK